ncbi:protein EXPRESSION OF TERPENOIDS 1-like [Impatiens glandulifera]|uniref:protein EXPRESSION OF TERPENOIDS 1-like n=1 Tax=Impatiens glandulifera TaxID=253017 RepID=UPI001FB0BCF0|nr:protein EXPRESSION OF TERPENOIDS 1-like [Impatiens glandulifera]
MMRGGSSTARCQECGNQSKKDCGYMRCRTCCKSRGFQCATHVKSTWIPLSLRRPRQQQFFQHSQLHNDDHQLQTQSTIPNPKRTKPFNLTSNTSSSGMQNGDQFPAEATMKATFKCVRMMSSTDDVVNQCAYQTSVNIGGHVFKGVLYDQGPDNDHHQDQDHDHQRNQTACYSTVADPW